MARTLRNESAANQALAEQAKATPVRRPAGLPAQQFTATESLALPFERDGFAPDRQVHVGHQSRAVRSDGFRAAMRATRQVIPASQDADRDSGFGFEGFAGDQTPQVQHVQVGGAP